MSEDFARNRIPNGYPRINAVLLQIKSLLEQHNKSLNDYDLLPLKLPANLPNELPRLIANELNIPVSVEDLTKIDLLNEDQKLVFNTIIKYIEMNLPAVIFVDGPAGSGKTFLYLCLLAKIRSTYSIALATASSGIAALLMPGGQTAHSRFKIPLNIDSTSTCSISKQSHLARLLKLAKLIIWDEISMMNRCSIEALDKTLRDIMDCDLPFGGKIFVFGGDFRQILPVIPRGSHSQIVNATFKFSSLWSTVKIFRLRQNMRVENSSEANEFKNFLLRIGDGTEKTIDNDMIRVPDNIVIDCQNEQSLQTLIEQIYPILLTYSSDIICFTDKAILTTKNEYVDYINDTILNQLPSEDVTYQSFDSVPDDTRNLYQQEFLNSINTTDIPPHQLHLKINTPIICLRNLDPINGLYNGTKLICKAFSPNIVEAEITTGNHRGKRIFLPRIPFMTSDNKFPFTLKRKQFPVKLAFAITINKSQGQTISQVGLYLPEHVFTHGQLYVTFSRVRSYQNIKVLIKNGKIPGKQGTYTRNVVYKEILQN